jgi:hypothetical protein
MKFNRRSLTTLTLAAALSAAFPALAADPIKIGVDGLAERALAAVRRLS